MEEKEKRKKDYYTPKTKKRKANAKRWIGRWGIEHWTLYIENWIESHQVHSYCPIVFPLFSLPTVILTRSILTTFMYFHSNFEFQRSMRVQFQTPSRIRISTCSAQIEDGKVRTSYCILYIQRRIDDRRSSSGYSLSVCIELRYLTFYLAWLYSSPLFSFGLVWLGLATTNNIWKEEINFHG